jgi:hypothetical protein
MVDAGLSCPLLANTTKLSFGLFSVILFTETVFIEISALFPETVKSSILQRYHRWTTQTLGFNVDSLPLGSAALPLAIAKPSISLESKFVRSIKVIHTRSLDELD